MSSALQRQVSEAWTRGDRAGVDRTIACGTPFYALMALLQIISLLGVAHFALPYTKFRGPSYALIVEDGTRMAARMRRGSSASQMSGACVPSSKTAAGARSTSVRSTSPARCPRRS